jgi:hypothetical protein
MRIQSIVFWLALILSFHPALMAQSAKVMITTEFVNTLPRPSAEALRKAREDSKNGSKNEDESRKVAVTVRNMSRQEFPGSAVKFYIFGRTAGEPGLQLLAEEEKAMPIGTGATATAESKSVTASFKPAHSQKEGGRVKASGTKITGYGVKVMDGGVVLGEYFTSSDAKALADAKSVAVQ